MISPRIGISSAHSRIYSLSVVILSAVVSGSLSRSSEKEYKAGKCAWKEPYPLLLIGLDGFRPDYLTRGFTPNIAWIGNDGVRAEYMTPMFPANTAPNFYSITTGLYPESHGIVDNCFEDPALNDTFCSEESCWRRQRSVNSTGCDPKWWRGEPIWVTAAKNKFKTGSYFWKYGAQAPINGILPTYMYKFNLSVPLDHRTVDVVIDWMEMPQEKRPRLMLVYFKEPDLIAHANGPTSPQVNHELVKIDRLIHRLLIRLKKRSLLNCVNMILLSDHGMTGNSCNRIIRLQDYELYTGNVVEQIMEMGSSTAAMWTPKPGANAQAIRDAVRGKVPHLRIFLRNELPKRLHLAHNNRTEDLIVMADCNWMIGYNLTTSPWTEGGTHGYDALEQKMQAFFVARGPSFKQGLVVKPFQNIEVYNLMADLLGIAPAPNNGTRGSLNHLLKSSLNLKVAKMTGDGHKFKNTCEGEGKGHKKNLKKLRKLASMVFPWGPPEGGAGERGCLLTRGTAVIGYSESLKLPLWRGERLTTLKDVGDRRLMKKKSDRNKPKILLRKLIRTSKKKRRNRARKSVRKHERKADKKARRKKVNSEEKEGTVVWVPLSLRDDGDSNRGAFSEKENVPMYAKFYHGVWWYLRQLTQAWSGFYPVFSIVGAVFDEDGDGFRDSDYDIERYMLNTGSTIALPTHYYAILTRCVPAGQAYSRGVNGVNVSHCDGELDSLAVILPHLNLEACATQTASECVLENVIAIKDLERLTGTNFFGNLLPVLQAQHKTRLPLRLWGE